MNNFIYGKGSKSIFTAIEILEAIKAGKKYIDAIGNGLSIGGLNISSKDQVIRFSEGTDILVILAPELDPIELDCDFDSTEEVEENKPEMEETTQEVESV